MKKVYKYNKNIMKDDDDYDVDETRKKGEDKELKG